MEKLNEEKLPGCYLHRTAENDVARVEDRTFICCKKQEDAGPTNNWMDPQEMYAKLKKLYTGAMKGRTMYVIPYSMGVVGSPFAKYGIELTDSIYVVLNMAIMTRVGQAVADVIGDDFVKGLHAKADIDPANRYIVHFPEDNTIMSVNSGYGGNVLLGKKCFALRIASYLGRQQGWMAEHMLILGVENPQGEVRYLAAAFPSACGKTNLAMLIPPEHYRKAGWKVWCVGDDIAWLRIGPDGRLWAMNPEYGFFGVAPGTNAKSNPNALATTRLGTIFTNVVHNLDDNTVWWEGLDKNPPEHAVDWKGRPWNGKTATEKGAHPNSRFTAPAKNCPCISPEFESPQGVPISAIVFGGRRAKTAPLVYQSRDWGPRRVCGLHHGLRDHRRRHRRGGRGAPGSHGHAPPSAAITWPTTGSTGWTWREAGGQGPPGSSTSTGSAPTTRGTSSGPASATTLRVLEWILKRCFGEADAAETAIGYEPRPEDIDLEDSGVELDTLKGLLGVDKALWQEEVKGIREFYQKFGDKLPKELTKELDSLEIRMSF